MARNWRKNLVTEELEDLDILLPRFESLLNSIVDIILDRTAVPMSLHSWFHKRVSFKVFGQTKMWTPLTLTLTRQLIESLPNLSEEDVRQQVTLCFIEMWNFYKTNIKPGKRTSFVFYDYVRFNLVKHMASWISHQILLNTGDCYTPRFSEVTYLNEPDELDFSLGWVLLKTNTGVLSELSTRQKYLIYLRYVKSLSIIDIANLTKRHRSLVEKDFSMINIVLGIGGHYVNSRITL